MESVEDLNLEGWWSKIRDKYVKPIGIKILQTALGKI